MTQIDVKDLEQAGTGAWYDSADADSDAGAVRRLVTFVAAAVTFVAAGFLVASLADANVIPSAVVGAFAAIVVALATDVIYVTLARRLRRR